jgi:hypothetical protein
MSDNESFESQTETEGSTDNEDIAELVAYSDYEEDQTDEDGILHDTLEARLM